MLRYGFIFKKTDVSEVLLKQPKKEVLERLTEEIQRGDCRRRYGSLIKDYD